MAKRKVKAKRSLASLPKGLPTKQGLDVNPFEVTKGPGRRAKHDVNNRFTNSTTKTKTSNGVPTTRMMLQPSKLAESLQRRQAQQRAALQSSKKVNSFVDRRIGEYTMSQEDKMLARLVRERSTRSKRVSKYMLGDDDDDNNDHLTHKGKAINQTNIMNHVILDSDEEDGGNLDAMDTEMNFGGLDSGEVNPYGPSGGQHNNMAQVYTQKKNDLDEMIKRRKMMKAEKLMSKEKQEETFESLDQGFDELAQLLQFRDKETERKMHLERKRAGQLTEDDQEMAEWDKEMKTYLFERKAKATDRTKTPEEIAKDEADRLHELETKRLARMNGDFERDQLSDISDDEGNDKQKNRRKKKKKSLNTGAEALDDSDDEKKDDFKVKFTADGLVYVDKEGKVIKKVGGQVDQDEQDEDDHSAVDNEDDSEDEEESDDADEHDEESKPDHDTILEVGTAVKANYRAKEQFEGRVTWYDGKIAAVHTDKAGNITYDVEYDDGDYEDGVEPAQVRVIKQSQEQEKERKKREEALILKRKRQKAKEKARGEIPYVFEVPTTLDALHDMIGNYASTGKEVSLIIDRIHASNSVRLNKKNIEKMQNFYDVLLRRFIAVGDAIYSSGNGGDELARYEQLNALTRTLFAMSQDAPESAAAVWGRRLGVFQNAHAKRLRDTELLHDGDDEVKTAWPSMGTILLLKALSHIFPVTDRRHQVVTPALLLLCQIVAQTPIVSNDDLVSALLCTGLTIEYSREARRVVPEALAFLSGVLSLFSTVSSVKSQLPTLKDMQATNFRKTVSEYSGTDCPMLSIEQVNIGQSSTPTAILCSALHLVDQCVEALGGCLGHAEPEAFAEIVKVLLTLNPNSTTNPLPSAVGTRVTATASKLSKFMSLARPPLARRSGPSRQDMAIKSLAPRLEDPDRYRMSKDQGKNPNQAALDRSRREYKREHKAVARELRMDGAFAEEERRREQDKRDSKARAKRHKNFAWLESEQGAMNQQVAQGGGLLSGGGMGAARAKAKSAKLGIKKGGKF